MSKEIEEEQSRVPMINGVEVKVGQWWENKEGNIRFKIDGIHDDWISCCYTGAYYSFKFDGTLRINEYQGELDLVKLIEGV